MTRAARLRRTAGRVAANTGLAVASFLAGALLAEAVVRLVAPQQLILIRPDLWQPADTVGWSHRPNVAVQINTGERTVTFFTDVDGFRVGRDGRHDARLQVLLVGDSFMEALQVEHEETTAHLLEQALSDAVGQPVVVRNAGVVGWNPNQYLLRTRALLARDTLALVVVAVFVGNDAVSRRLDYVPPRQPVERHHFRLPGSARWREIVDAWLAPVNDALEVRSHAFILAKNRLGAWRKRLGLTGEAFPSEYRTAEAASPRWALTADVAADLAAAAAARGVPVLFVLIPFHFQVYERQFHDEVRGYGVDPDSVDIDQPSHRLYDEFTARRLHVIDALPTFRARAGAPPRLFGTVDPHLSAAGHAALTELIVPAALPLLAPAPAEPPGRSGDARSARLHTASPARP